MVVGVRVVAPQAPVGVAVAVVAVALMAEAVAMAVVMTVGQSAHVMSPQKATERMRPMRTRRRKPSA